MSGPVKIYNLRVRIGSKKTGEAIWKNVGVVMEDSMGPFMLLDKTFNPAGVADPKEDKTSIKIGMFAPRDYDGYEDGNVG